MTLEKGLLALLGEPELTTIVIGAMGLFVAMASYIFNRLRIVDAENKSLKLNTDATQVTTNENKSTLDTLSTALRAAQEDIRQEKEQRELSDQAIKTLERLLNEEKKARVEERKNSDEVIKSLNEKNTRLEARITTIEQQLATEKIARVDAENRLQEQFDLRVKAETEVAALTIEVGKLNAKIEGLMVGMRAIQEIRVVLEPPPPPDRPPTPGGGGGKIVPINGDSELDSNEVEKKDAA